MTSWLVLHLPMIVNSVLVESLQTPLTHRERFQHEFPSFIHPKPRIRLASSQATVLLTLEGKPISQMSGLHSWDITERKQSELQIAKK